MQINMKCSKYLKELTNSEQNELQNNDIIKHLESCVDCTNQKEAYEVIHSVLCIYDLHDSKEVSLDAIYNKIKAEAEEHDLLDIGWMEYYKKAFKLLIRPVHAVALVLIFVLSTVGIINLYNNELKKQFNQYYFSEAKALKKLLEQDQFLLMEYDFISGEKK